MLAAATLASGVSPLTARERDVLVAARPGATVAEIAGKLCLSEGTRPWETRSRCPLRPPICSP